jgi:hypothetical protein
MLKWLLLGIISVQLIIISEDLCRVFISMYPLWSRHLAHQYCVTIVPLELNSKPDLNIFSKNMVIINHPNKFSSNLFKNIFSCLVEDTAKNHWWGVNGHLFTLVGGGEHCPLWSWNLQFTFPSNWVKAPLSAEKKNLILYFLSGVTSSVNSNVDSDQRWVKNIQILIHLNWNIKTILTLFLPKTKLRSNCWKKFMKIKNANTVNP